MSDMTGKVLGWLSILAGVIGFFLAPLWLGAVAVILGLITLASPQKVVAWIGIVIGVIVLLIHIFS